MVQLQYILKVPVDEVGNQVQDTHHDHNPTTTSLSNIHVFQHSSS